MYYIIFSCTVLVRFLSAIQPLSPHQFSLYQGISVDFGLGLEQISTMFCNKIITL